jgi:predicted Zn-dependent protease
VAQEAITAATQQRNAVRAEPGRYTAILSATAVGQLLQQMAQRFNLEYASPFSFRGVFAGDRDRKGERLFDPRITLTTDPTDPEGGDFPFFPEGAPYPSGKVTWVENGILKQRSVNIGTGIRCGMTPLRDPECIRMSSSSSDGPTSIAEMIAQCERGIYVHRFSTIQDVDRWSATMEGFTRGGCLLIEHGKITHPVKDFRFYDSPVLAFNRVLALGPPQRVAFGFTPRDGDKWPYAPVIAPPLMIRDFNFSALADNT